MKINNSQPPALSPVGAPAAAGKATTGTSAGAGDKPAPASISSSVADISARLADATHDIDAARVEEVRQAIVNGELEIDVDRIAEGLLDNLRGR